jgi:hypothetical protein
MAKARGAARRAKKIRGRTYQRTVHSRNSRRWSRRSANGGTITPRTRVKLIASALQSPGGASRMITAMTAFLPNIDIELPRAAGGFGAASKTTSSPKP